MTVHSVTGVTPDMAMLGREVLTPVTLIAQPPHEPVKLTVPYVTSFRNAMREALLAILAEKIAIFYILGYSVIPCVYLSVRLM